MRFPVSFTKMSGAGNDFILLDHRRPLFADTAAAQRFAKGVCERKFAVGADGLILIEGSDRADFRWQFFNADGSIAEMCGNGARCAARFAHERGIAPARMTFLTLAGMIEAEVVGTSVLLTMTPPLDGRLNQRLPGPDGREVTVHSLNTGVPHAVIFSEELERVPVREWGCHFRFHPHFAPAGTNVNFVARGENNLLRVRTYERGVEDETLACGTGAVASALVAARLGLVASPTRIITSGREELVIHYRLAGEEFSQVRLEGPADFIYEGSLHQEALRRA
ncbi:MAG TPA: diaminopimelate epimerase [Desulfurivibrio alkaliphilus]|uniref:Diaminopimelate epimerase n=1 Tax=Desulfurivibrio alkaliphilus TaxID=427923 RepID=A0A7C2TKH0_9BACT|nr:diaminopimelate epimerase [Desulfurivibrio alkaliphilus]